MREAVLGGLSLALLAGPPALASSPLAGDLGALAFMIGEWKSVGDPSGPDAGGTSSIEPDLSGRLLIRRDHVLTTAGQAFDIYMAMYDDGGSLRAEFVDTEGHVIHYAVTPAPDGRSAVFVAPASQSGPGFRLTYAAAPGERLHIRCEIAPPGGAYKVYAEGDVARR